MEFHTIKSVKTLSNMILEVEFNNGIHKIYDIKKILNKYEVLKKLENEKIFNSVKVDNGGYGIVWDENIDLSSEEIWNNGEEI